MCKPKLLQAGYSCEITRVCGPWGFQLAPQVSIVGGGTSPHPLPYI